MCVPVYLWGWGIMMPVNQSTYSHQETITLARCTSRLSPTTFLPPPFHRAKTFTQTGRIAPPESHAPGHGPPCFRSLQRDLGLEGPVPQHLHLRKESLVLHLDREPRPALVSVGAQRHGGIVIQEPPFKLPIA